MFHTCAVIFDVTENLEIFLVFRAKQGSSQNASPRRDRQLLSG